MAAADEIPTERHSRRGRRSWTSHPWSSMEKSDQVLHSRGDARRGNALVPAARRVGIEIESVLLIISTETCHLDRRERSSAIN